jgi:hypothetical protein
MGLPLLAQSARETGGNVSIRSIEGKGTIVKADFRQGHIDMKPLGNIVDTLMVLIAGNPEVDFVFTYRLGGEDHSFDTREIKAELEGVPINVPPVISVVREQLAEILTAIGIKKDVK